MKLAVRIQHVESRPHWVKVLDQLIDHRAQIISNGSCWDTAKKCLQSVEPDDTHVLVLQDDVIPCQDFIATVEKIVTMMPDEAITFFTYNRHVPDAMKQGWNWLRMRLWFMAQAYVFPVPMANDIISWSEANVKPEVVADDERYAMYFVTHNRYVYATAPSLVEHLGWNNSSLNRYSDHHAFEAKRRTASRFIGFEESGLSIDWSRWKGCPIDDHYQGGMFTQWFINPPTK